MIYESFNVLRSCDLSVHKLTRDSEDCQPPADKFLRDLTSVHYKDCSSISVVLLTSVLRIFIMTE